MSLCTSMEYPACHIFKKIIKGETNYNQKRKEKKIYIKQNDIIREQKHEMKIEGGMKTNLQNAKKKTPNNLWKSWHHLTPKIIFLNLSLKYPGKIETIFLYKNNVLGAHWGCSLS